VLFFVISGVIGDNIVISDAISVAVFIDSLNIRVVVIGVISVIISVY